MNVVFDIDGTIADCTHRIHLVKGGRHDWDAFFEACGNDNPIPQLIAVLDAMVHAGHDVRLFTGRPERTRRTTEMWLDQHLGFMASTLPIYMRKDDDHRADDIVKAEFLEHFRPALVFDDRQRVVDMWRSHGIRVCQVAVGDF